MLTLIRKIVYGLKLIKMQKIVFPYYYDIFYSWHQKTFSYSVRIIIHMFQTSRRFYTQLVEKSLSPTERGVHRKKFNNNNNNK